MTSTEWHVGADLLAQYAAGRLDDVAQAGIETHLTGCPACRADAASLVGPAELATSWEAVATRIAAPRLSVTQRFLQRAGFREADLVVLRTSTGMAVAFAVALCASVAFAVASAYLRSDAQQVFYLFLAPLLPVILVAGAYDATDPLRELAGTTSFSQLRVALLRTALAVSCALPLMAGMALVPNISIGLSTWLLPSLTLTVAALALLTWIMAIPAVTTVSAVWLTAVTILKAGASVDAAGGAAAQVLLVIVLLISAYVFLARVGLVRPKGVWS